MSVQFMLPKSSFKINLSELLPPSLKQVNIDISKNFEVKFGISNLVINARNSNGRLLHVNKEFLCFFSSYFRNEFKNDQDECSMIEIEEEYSFFKEILTVLHHKTSPKRYPSNPFYDFDYKKSTALGRIAKKYGMDTIWNFFYDSFLDWSPNNALEVVFEMEMTDLLPDLIPEADAVALIKLLDEGHHYRVSSDLAKTIFKTCVSGNSETKQQPSNSLQSNWLMDAYMQQGQPHRYMPEPASCEDRKTISYRDLYKDTYRKPNYREALPKEFFNVTIKANDGKITFNKSVLATFSPYFRALFFSHFTDRNETVMDTDMFTVKYILDFICVYESPSMTLPQFVELYKASDKYDIPIIREYLKEQYIHFSVEEALEVVIRLDLEELKAKFLQKMSKNQIIQFFQKTSLDFSLKEVAVFVETLEPCKKCKLPKETKGSVYKRDPLCDCCGKHLTPQQCIRLGMQELKKNF